MHTINSSQCSPAIPAIAAEKLSSLRLSSEPFDQITDGSGTRRVVQILSQLGVTMVSEDPETYDIHADIIGGWPNVVTPVLEVQREDQSVSLQSA